MKPCAGAYIRVSTEMQAERDSVINQEVGLCEYAKKHGFDIELYKDIGIFAKDQNRPEFQRLLNDIRNRKITTVIVTKLDRITRRLRDLIELKEFFETYETNFISITQNLDTTTPIGRFTFYILGLVAQWEREVTAERVADDMCARARRKKWNGGVIPYGYTTRQRLIDDWFKDSARKKMSDNSKSSIEIDELIKQLKTDPVLTAKAENHANNIASIPKTLFIDKNEAKIVEKVFDIFLEKGSFRYVVHEVNKRGYKTRAGGFWASQSIKRILQNPTYYGALTYNRRKSSGKSSKPRPQKEHIVVEDAIEPIISKEKFLEVQALIKNSKKTTPTGNKLKYPLSGVLKCGQCGSKMFAVTFPDKRNKDRIYSYYRCNGHLSKGASFCGGMSIKRFQIEQLVEESLEMFALNPGKLEKLATDQLNQEIKSWDRISNQNQVQKSDLRLISNKREKLIELYEDGLIDKATFKRRDSSLDQKKEMLLKEIEEFEKFQGSGITPVDIQAVSKQLMSLNDVYGELKVFEKRELLQNIFQSVDIKEHEITFKVFANPPNFVNPNYMDRDSWPPPA